MTEDNINIISIKNNVFSLLSTCVSFFIVFGIVVKKRIDDPRLTISSMINDTKTAVLFSTALLFYTMSCLSYYSVLTYVLEKHGIILRMLGLLHLAGVVFLYVLLYLNVDTAYTEHFVFSGLSFGFIFASDWLYAPSFHQRHNFIFLLMWLVQLVPLAVFAVDTKYVEAEYVFVLICLISKHIKLTMLYHFSPSTPTLRVGVTVTEEAMVNAKLEDVEKPEKVSRARKGRTKSINIY